MGGDRKRLEGDPVKGAVRRFSICSVIVAARWDKQVNPPIQEQRVHQSAGMYGNSCTEVLSRTPIPRSNDSYFEAVKRGATQTPDSCSRCRGKRGQGSRPEWKSIAALR